MRRGVNVTVRCPWHTWPGQLPLRSGRPLTRTLYVCKDFHIYTDFASETKHIRWADTTRGHQLSHVTMDLGSVNSIIEETSFFLSSLNLRNYSQSSQESLKWPEHHWKTSNSHGRHHNQSCGFCHLHAMSWVKFPFHSSLSSLWVKESLPLCMNPDHLMDLFC